MTRPPTAPSNAGLVLEQIEQMQRQLDRLREQISHCHRLTTLGTLSAILAHEFNNILTPVISYAQMALAGPPDPAALASALQKALSGAERAATISQAILGFARHGEQPSQASLREVVDQTFACLMRDPRKDGIEVEVDVPDVAAAITPVALQQVLVNLVLNAIQAMGGNDRRQGSATRRLAVVGRTVGDRVVLEVRDTGPGIPPEVRGRLFEPFVTGSDPASRGGKQGTGLGLCICRELIEAAGGSISLASETGRGATFRITLRRATDSAAAAVAA